PGGTRRPICSRSDACLSRPRRPAGIPRDAVAPAGALSRPAPPSRRARRARVRTRPRVGGDAMLVRSSRMFAALALSLANLQAASGEPGRGLTIARIEGELDVGMQALVHRAILEAKARGDTLVLEIDTPGGPVELMFQIAREILGASDKD